MSRYRAPLRFTGTLQSVTVDLSGELISDPEAELKIAHGTPVADR